MYIDFEKYFEGMGKTTLYKVLKAKKSQIRGNKHAGHFMETHT